MNSLVEHGIHTTKADYWIHLFPTEDPCKVFWYRVDLMREFIRLTKPPLLPGKSKDGTVTGAGYLIRRDASLVFNEIVPAWIIEGYVWEGKTDREFGFQGEHVVAILIERRIVSVPILRAKPASSAAEQYAGKDFHATYFGEVHFEAKTERLAGSGNLFVQTREGGHRVHLASTNGDVVERVTAAPGFSEDRRS